MSPRSHIFALQRNCLRRFGFLYSKRCSGGHGRAEARGTNLAGFASREKRREGHHMKKALPIVLAAVGLASVTATPAFAIDGLSANAAVTTNYVFRGISQSGGQAAVQAGLDYNIPGVTGFAVGTWASSIDFGNANGEDTPLEWDLYGSYTYAINDKFSLSVGAIHYTYPNSPHGVNYNWYEGWAGAGYNFGFATVGGKI